MKSKASSRFWKLYHQLPESIQQLADKNYQLWQANHRHPSIGFKKLKGGKKRFSVRVGDITAPLVNWRATRSFGFGSVRMRNTIKLLTGKLE